MRPEIADGRTWLSWTGMETDLIFRQGRDLPGFAAFPLLDDETGRAQVAQYYRDQIEVAGRVGALACLESVTWMANRDRAAPLGWSDSDLRRINREAIALMAESAGDAPVCLSAQIGPRGDGYLAGNTGVDEARAYHAQQIETLAGCGADIISAFTIASVPEAVGIARAAADAACPLALSFTVETDGRLADGRRLAEAMAEVDDRAATPPAYYLANCAHPDHLAAALDGAPALRRLAGLVANASRQSHAELDGAEHLDDGSPQELGVQLAAMRAAHPWMNVFGGCCGTDMRHLTEIGHAVAAAARAMPTEQAERRP